MRLWVIDRSERCGFPAVPASARDARHWVDHLLESWHVDGSVRDDVALVVSELATNAILHNGPSFVAEACPDTSEIVVSIVDQTPGSPSQRTPDDSGGRGLAIVAALATSWGTDDVSGGKRVWAKLRMNPSPGGAAT